MNTNNDYLSPEHSPKKLQTTGVKRVNNIPLVIALGILTLFVLLIALVANKRANAQNQPPEIASIKSHKMNTMTLANEIVESHKTSVIPPHRENNTQNTPATLLMPAPQITPKKEFVRPGPSDAELERIRQEKMQDFEEAVKAKTSIMADNSR